MSLEINENPTLLNKQKWNLVLDKEKLARSDDKGLCLLSSRSLKCSNIGSRHIPPAATCLRSSMRVNRDIFTPLSSKASEIAKLEIEREEKDKLRGIASKFCLSSSTKSNSFCNKSIKQATVPHSPRFATANRLEERRRRSVDAKGSSYASRDSPITVDFMDPRKSSGNDINKKTAKLTVPIPFNFSVNGRLSVRREKGTTGDQAGNLKDKNKDNSMYNKIEKNDSKAKLTVPKSPNFATSKLLKKRLGGEAASL